MIIRWQSGTKRQSDTLPPHDGIHVAVQIHGPHPNLKFIKSTVNKKSATNQAVCDKKFRFRFIHVSTAKQSQHSFANRNIAT